MFLRQNLRAVGVEEIVKQANVAKISLYRSFAYLERRNADFWRQMDEDFYDWMAGCEGGLGHSPISLRTPNIVVRS